MLTVTITQSAIDAAAWNMCGYCPIACALEALTGIRWFVTQVDVVPLARLCDRDWPHVLLPEEARAWVKRGDAGEPVEPITFPLPLAPADWLAA